MPTKRPRGGSSPLADRVNAGQSVSRPRLLFIDDDAAIGGVVSRMLRDTFDVTVHTSARAAYARIAAGEPYDAIVCDLMMPDMTGMDLHQRLSETDPAGADRIVFVTGGTFTPSAEDFLRYVKNPRLEKPFDRAELLAAVAVILSRSSGRR